MSARDAFGELPGGRELAELAREVSACGRSLWVVGGAVRDILLGRPVDEIDLVTDLPLDDLGRLLRIHAVGRGRDFGTVVAVVGDRPFEVSELRGGTSGQDPVDARLSADAGCRDFTVNALYLDQDGRVFDCVGGRDDLQAGIIRGVGDPVRRFEEDPVRILRGVRLAVQLGFAIEPVTARAMAARAGFLAGVPGERLARELTKMASLGGSALAGGVELMRENGSLAVVLPEMAALDGAEHRPEHHPEGDAYRHTLAALRSWEGRDPLTGLAILLHDIGKGPAGSRVGGAGRYPGHARAGAGMVPELVGRLRLPGAWAESLAFVADRHMLLHRLGELRPSTLRRLVADPGMAAPAGGGPGRRGRPGRRGEAGTPSGGDSAGRGDRPDGRGAVSEDDQGSGFRPAGDGGDRPSAGETAGRDHRPGHRLGSRRRGCRRRPAGRGHTARPPGRGVMTVPRRARMAVMGLALALAVAGAFAPAAGNGFVPYDDDVLHHRQRGAAEGPDRGRDCLGRDDLPCRQLAPPDVALAHGRPVALRDRSCRSPPGRAGHPRGDRDPADARPGPPHRRGDGSLPGRPALRPPSPAGRVGGLGRRAQGPPVGLLLDGRPGRLCCLSETPGMGALPARLRLPCGGAAVQADGGHAAAGIAAPRRLAAGEDTAVDRPGPGREGPAYGHVAGGRGARLDGAAGGGAVGLWEFIPWRYRLANAVLAAGAYLWRTVRPVRLAFFYPHPATASPRARWSPPACSWWRSPGRNLLDRRFPAGIAGWAWYLVTLLPVLGLVQVGAQAKADRYTYLPQAGLALLLPGLWLAMRGRRRVLRGSTRGAPLSGRGRPPGDRQADPRLA